MHRSENFFRWLAILILALTGVAKLTSSMGSAALLDLPDPLLGMSNRELLIAVGLLELAVSAAMLSPIHPRQKHLLLLWLSTSFLVYRISFHWINPGAPCPCLGSLHDNLPLSQGAIDGLLWAIVIFLIAGSVALLLGQRVKAPLTDARGVDDRRPAAVQLDEPCA